MHTGNAIPLPQPPRSPFVTPGRRPRSAERQASFRIAARTHSRHPAGLPGIIPPREGRSASFWSRASPSAHLSPARRRRTATARRKYFFRRSRFCTLEMPLPRRSPRAAPLQPPVGAPLRRVPGIVTVGSRNVCNSNDRGETGAAIVSAVVHTKHSESFFSIWRAEFTVRVERMKRK